MSTGLVILAAGASTRLGRPKQLLEYRGQPLLQHLIDLADQTICNPSLVILGSGAEEIKERIDSKSLEVIENPEWEEGIASSIRFGLSYLGEKNPDVKHVLFLLSDQPYLTIDVINELLKLKGANKSITACEYNDQVGVPAIFSHHFFEDLMRLEGDSGAKKIILQNMDYVSMVPFVGGEMDIDTEEDYERLN